MSLTAYSPHKVTAVPASYAANDVFFVAPASDPTKLEIHVANSAGTALRRLNTTTDIQGMIDASVALVGTGTIEDDIAARDAIAAPKNSQQVLVLDATGDATVTSGSATYVYKADTAEWIKISESESMDVVATWAAITGKPNSTPADIDSAVAQMHSHSNKTQLDLIDQDVNGNMLYDGSLPVSGWASAAW